MNNIYFIGKITFISNIKFDYYNKLKASMEIELSAGEKNQKFKIDINEKFCESN